MLFGFVGLGVVLGVVLGDRRDRVRKVGTSILIYAIVPVQTFIILTTNTVTLSFVMVAQIVALEVGSVVLLMGVTLLYWRRRGHERGHEIADGRGAVSREGREEGLEDEDGAGSDRENDDKKLGSYLYLNAFPNAMLYPLPIVLAAFPDALVVVLVLFSAAALVVRGTLGTYVGEKLGGDVESRPLRTLAKLFTFPPFLGILVAVVFLAFQVPVPTDAFLAIKPVFNEISTGLGATIIGIILSTLTHADLAAYKRDVGTVALFRFGFASLFYLSVTYFLRFDAFQAEIRTILFLVVIGPPAIFNVVFSVHFGLEEKFAAVTVASLTLVALGLLPLILWLGPVIF